MFSRIWRTSVVTLDRGAYDTVNLTGNGQYTLREQMWNQATTYELPNLPSHRKVSVL